MCGREANYGVRGGRGFAKAKVLAQRHSSKVSKTSDLARAAAFSSLTREPPSSLDAASP